MPTPWSQDAYLEAYRFAAEAHLGQLYPGTEISYLMHLGFVSMELLAALAVEEHADGDLAVRCALLHDTVEDTAITRGQLVERFGEAVAAGVAALTKNEALPKAERMSDSLRRIREQPREVWLVKLADRISNLAPPPAHWDAAKIAAYRVEAAEILSALGDASPFLAARLRTRMEGYPRR
jgi:(p)ppGpp synthase/HD superfamily hydrolase